MKTLLLIDIQNDFMPGGALAVPGGDEIIPVVNALMADFDLIVATQDWHPAEHGSFAKNHPGTKVFDQIELDGLASDALACALCAKHGRSTVCAVAGDAADRPCVHEGDESTHRQLQRPF